MKNKLKIALEFSWYALIAQAVILGYAYFLNHGKLTLNHLWMIPVTMPMLAICIYQGHVHFKLGVEEIKDSYKREE